MKAVKIILVVAILLGLLQKAYSQSLNWQSLQKEQKHILNLNAGAEYGMVGGVSYGYQLKTKLPVILTGEYSSPFGKVVFDDFKTKIGAQVRLVNIDGFCVSAKATGVFRRFENPLVRLVNFGSDFSGTIGYYKPKWYVALEGGFDKAIVTHFKHSGHYRQFFPSVEDGWYQPPTGGNFYYGLQTGVSFKKYDITLKAGKMVSQGFKTAPMSPFYAQLGFNLRLVSFN